MSLAGNSKIVGWALFIVGLLMVISALLQIYDGATADGDLGDNIGLVIAGIGALIAAVIYFRFGNGVRKGSVSGKTEVLGGFVHVIGMATVVVGLFAAIGAILDDATVWDGIVDVIIGIIILWFAKNITDGKKTFSDKLVWIILLVVFVILFIVGLLGALDGGIIDIIANICMVIVYLFMIVYLLDGEVRKDMGI